MERKTAVCVRVLDLRKKSEASDDWLLLLGCLFFARPQRSSLFACLLGWLWIAFVVALLCHQAVKDDLFICDDDEQGGKARKRRNANASKPKIPNDC